ncbi:hypothetical protein SS50377_26113 [Spironucleus salmonicida]|uniref:Uncharacterized protein n=1 Tax=Spironucleus salmonicida TaxID=348837 RepID=A0A9P8LPJ3_9EUKA|nr:hypothetical protein SS50377_26113 [Spironucleus salmonicida]
MPTEIVYATHLKLDDGTQQHKFTYAFNQERRFVNAQATLLSKELSIKRQVQCLPRFQFNVQPAATSSAEQQASASADLQKYLKIRHANSPLAPPRISCESQVRSRLATTTLLCKVVVGRVAENGRSGAMSPLQLARNRKRGVWGK